MNYSMDIMKFGQQLLDLSQVRMDICNNCIFLDYDYSQKEHICIILHDVYNGFGNNNKCDEKLNSLASLNA